MRLMTTAWPPQFLFAVCQCGAEQALKQEIAVGPINARPAFSRPGFVTFKLDEPCADPEQFQFPATFARTYGFSLGKVRGESTNDLVEQTWNLPVVQELLAAEEIADLHVWQRDTAMPGVRGFEPGPTALGSGSSPTSTAFPRMMGARMCRGGATASPRRCAAS